MSASSLISAMDEAGGRSNSAAASMAFEEWVDENASKIFWSTSDAKNIFSYFNNDAVMHSCIEYLIDQFVGVGGSYTCTAVASILSATTNESVKLSVIEKMAPLIRDKGNKNTILYCFDNAACRMQAEDYF